MDERRNDDVDGSVKLLRRSRLLLIFFGCELFFTDSRKKLLQKLRRRVLFVSLSAPAQSSGDKRFISVPFSHLFSVYSNSFKIINVFLFQQIPKIEFTSKHSK